MRCPSLIVAGGLSVVVASSPIALAALAALPRQGAEPPPPGDQAAWPPEGIDDALRDLESPEYPVRERATRAINQDDRLTLPVLERVLRERGAAMSPEARERVLNAARARFVKAPRAAMGVGFGDPSGLGVQLNNRIVINQTIKPFDSVRVLEIGDIITHADGQELHGPDVLLRIRGIIISHDPGETIDIVVRRGRERLPLTVRLGSFDDLAKTGNAAMDPESLQRAWRCRAARAATDGADPVRVDVPPTEWFADASALLDPTIRRAIRDRNPVAADADMRLRPVSGGGSPRVLMGGMEEPQRVVQQFVVANGRNRIRLIANNAGGFFGVPRMTPAEELSTIVITRRRAEQNARAGGVMKIDGNIRPERDSLAGKIAMLRKWEDAIRAEMTEAGLTLPDDADADSHAEGDKGEK